jgi:predicted small lipoprotein YifL
MIRRFVLLAVVLLAAYGGFRWGPRFFPPIERALGIESSEEVVENGPSPELAEETLDRFERFRAGEEGSRLMLGGDELSSVVRYALPGIVPPGVAEPTVELEDGKVTVSARVAVEDFPRLPSLDKIIGLLPDTVLIEMRGSLIPLDQAHLALVMDRIRAAKIPIPTRMMSGVLEGLGRKGPVSLPDDALQVPLPDGLESAFVQRDSLVLLRKQSEARPGGAAGR